MKPKLYKAAFVICIVWLLSGTVSAQGMTLFGITSDSLVTINPSTGAVTSTGYLGAGYAPVSDLAWHAGMGKLFGVANFATSPRLIEINRSTGAVTVIGNLDIVAPSPLNIGICEGLSYNPQDGLLYASMGTAAPNSNILATIDPATGNATTVTGFSGTCGGGEFDELEWAGSTLFGFDICPPISRLYRTNNTNGASVLIKSFSTAINGLYSMTGLAHDQPNNQLIAFSAGTRQLFSINLSTAAHTIIGTAYPASRFPGGGLTGITFAPAPAPGQSVPTLSEWSLVVLGLTFLCLGAIALRQRNRLVPDRTTSGKD